MNICQILPHIQRFTIEDFVNFLEILFCYNIKFCAISFGR